MYGECQVMQQSSSPMIMGGLPVGSGEDGNMGMPMPIPMMNMNITMPSLGNPNHLSSFMSGMPSFHTFSSIIPKEEMGMMRNDEQELDPSGSGSGQIDGLSCGEEHENIDQQRQHDQDQNQPQLLDRNGKKKRYHRHTARQIQEMEGLFKECPHPDDKQRLRLSQELGLKPRQVKFWFQNRRTQMKAQHDRSDNLMLRAENENLNNENYRLQAAIRNVSCPNCGGPAILGEMSFDEQHLRLENARLKEELERLSCITARFGGRLIPPMGPTQPPLLPSLDLDMATYSRHFNNQGPEIFHEYISNGQQQYNYVFVGEEEKGVALDLAVSAAEQLLRMCRTNEPLWVRNGEGVAEVLDLEEYGRMFPAWPMRSKQLQGKEVRVDASRDSGHVMMNSVTLVHTMLNVEKWVELFPTVVANARTLQVVSTGLDNGSGSLQLMYAELQVLSPLVPTRDCYFFRYCKQNIEEGFWTVVDFPCDGLMQDGLNTTSSGYRRKPSGFIFQDMPNGYTMVTWVEQAEFEDKATHHIFDQFVRHGFAFGAPRWLSVLQHQCYRLASLMARNVADLGVIPTLEARKNLMVLSQRMIRTYCVNIICSSVSAQPWTVLSDSMNDTIRIITRKNTELGQPIGGIMTAVLTAWLPFTHQEVFELLTDERRRLQLDVVSGGNSRHEVAHIANGSHHKNCVSLFRINASGNSSHNVELMLQESSTHPTGGSLIVHSNIDIDAVQLAMSGKDPSYIPFLPTGYVILPATSPTTTDSSSPLGSLLTIGLQVLTSAVGSTKLNLPSVTAINNHLCNAISQITSALGSGAYPYNSAPAAAVPDQ